MENNKQEIQEQQEVDNNVNELEPENNSGENPSEEISETGKIDELTAKLAELQDKYLRLSAEFDNYRKRTLKERMELVKTAGEDILKDILPVIDDFDRANEIIKSSDSIEAIVEGTKLIYNKLKSTVENRGLAEISPAGEDFNPDIHEAIAKIQGTKEQSGKIIDVVQKGYSLNDKIIRHPKVVIGE
ncbi:MAG: nucleotide exchange factor GrpE [Prevotellaceae bacterium]|jgi:molecular chaperone GrpE|nr:nucleotide exchange factor GrpE [Prevotellaceae bacterium]